MSAYTSAEFVSIVALGIFAYRAGGATAVGVGLVLVVKRSPDDVTAASAASSVIRNAVGLRVLGQA